MIQRQYEQQDDLEEPTNNMTPREEVADSSPLDDYLRDVNQELEVPDMTGGAQIVNTQAADEDNDWGDETLINTSATPSKGWTGPQSNISGPSSPNRHSASAPMAVDDSVAFAERFKYLVCTSGLLEKDFVTSTSAGSGSIAASTEASEEQVPKAVLPVETRHGGISGVLSRVEWRWWIWNAVERWDIVLAGVVLVGAVIVVVGWVKIVTAAACLSVGSVLAEIWLSSRKRQTLHTPLPSPTSPPAPSPRALALQSLQSLLSSCSTLDASLSSSLATLSTTRGNALQSALHNLCSEMTDHIATASSSLQGLVDAGEMKILGEMYDIPLDGRGARLRISDLTESSGSVGKEIDEARVGVRYPMGLGAVPSPRREKFISPPSTIRPIRTLLETGGAGLTRSTSLRAHARHLPLVPAEQGASDHFTSIPQRTPRLVKRASWDVGDQGSKRRFSRGEEGGLLAAWKLAEPLKRSGSRKLIHEKRITEGDEEETGWSSLSGEESLPTDTSEDDAPPLPTAPTANGLRILSLPSSPTLSSPRQRLHTPKHTSPLGRSDHTSTPTRSGMSLTESAVRLASLSYHSPIHRTHSLSLNISPPTGNPKRRSLGNMPYCHPVPTSPLLSYAGSQGMSRTRSLQSDLQDARARSATGSRSRRTSMSLSVSSARSPPSPQPHFPEPLPFPRAHRVPSVSPLTTPALQAACLGVHMKRRKVACALLALRWDEADAYWAEVREVLDSLREGVEGEISKLTSVSAEDVAEVEGARLTPPWAGQASIGGSQSFAPTTSSRERMKAHVEVVQKALARAWEETAMVQRHLAAGDEGDGIARNWAGLREELGIMIREVERGKDTLASMITTPSLPSPEAIDEPPAFLQAWEDDAATHRSASIGTTALTDIPSPDPQLVDEKDEPEVLAPRGADEVFEADLIGSDRDTLGLGKMGREERMGLMRLAREQGMTLGEYLRNGGAEEKPDREVEKGGMMVVDELKGVIGLIREQKMGMAAEKKKGEDLPATLPEGDVPVIPVTGDAEGGSLPFSRFTRTEFPASPAIAGLSAVDVGNEAPRRDIRAELGRIFG